jgi:hypothetical protein
MALLNVFDQVPTDAQTIGDILDGGELGQLKHIPLEGLGVSAAGIGEPKIDLPHQVASRAENSLYRQRDKDRLKANRNRPKLPDAFSPTDDAAVAAVGTDQLVRFVRHGENYRTPFIATLNVVIAMNPKGMIQKTGGHDGLPPWFLGRYQKGKTDCPHLFKTLSTL